MSDRDYEPMGDYPIIGNCRSVALISKKGSLDWLCLPRFDNPSIFAAITDRTNGDRFSIAPREIVEIHRRYVEDTNVLETTCTTTGGKVALVDLMPVTSEEDKERKLTAQHEILRRVECLEGEVLVDIHYDPRPMDLSFRRSRSGRCTDSSTSLRAS